MLTLCSLVLSYIKGFDIIEDIKKSVILSFASKVLSDIIQLLNMAMLTAKR